MLSFSVYNFSWLFFLSQSDFTILELNKSTWHQNCTDRQSFSLCFPSKNFINLACFSQITWKAYASSFSSQQISHGKLILCTPSTQEAMKLYLAGTALKWDAVRGYYIFSPSERCPHARQYITSGTMMTVKYACAIFYLFFLAFLSAVWNTFLTLISVVVRMIL